MPSPNLPKFVRSPARASWKVLYRTRVNECHEEPDRHSGAHLDDPTHIATCLHAKMAITGGVPQGAFSDSTMKAAACIPTFLDCAAFHFQPNAIKSAVGSVLLTRSDSLVPRELVKHRPLPIDPPKLRISYQCLSVMTRNRIEP
jgi:hypothetical protein